MDGRCDNHAFEMAEDTCRQCGLPYCSECLVYAFGPSKPPFCVSCALSAAGVRKNAGKTRAIPKRELRRRERQRSRRAKRNKAERKAKASDGADVRPLEVFGDDGDLPPLVQPATESFDWSEPFDDSSVSAG